MEDFYGLVESSFERDLFRLGITCFCTYYKPLKLRPFHSQNEFDELKKDDFSGLPYSYESRDVNFHFSGMNTNAQIRFVELLAPLTLYHFSKVSKINYYDCLDIRGLQFQNLLYRSQPFTVGSLNGMEGRFNGFVRDTRWQYYSIYHGFAHFSLFYYENNPVQFGFVKRFKVLSFFCKPNLLDKMLDLCAAVIYPGTDHVRVHVSRLEYDTTELISLPQLTKFFDFCQQVKTLSIQDISPMTPHSVYAATFLEIKNMIEKWSTKNPNLEIFILTHMMHIFQLHNNVLKRLVNVGGTWFCSDKCDVDVIEYRKYKLPYNCGLLAKIPIYFKGLHHDDIFQIPFNVPAKDCVHEVLNIPSDKVGLIIGKKGRTLKWIESTFHVKLLLVQTDRKSTVDQKFLTIGGEHANVDQAKQQIQYIIDSHSEVFDVFYQV